MKKARLGSIDLAYSDQGQGPVLLLLHGFPLSHRQWRHQIEEFSSTHRVIVPDLRGHGDSTVCPGTVTMADMARDVAMLLDHLQIQSPIHLGGLSMGGYIAWEFWHQFPFRLRSMLLFDTRAQADTEEVARGRKMMAAQVVTEGVRLAVKSMVPKLIAPTTREDQPNVAEELGDMIASTDPEAIAATQRGMAMRSDWTNQLCHVDVDTLVVCGEHDGISPPDEMRGFASQMPRARFELITGAGHLAPLEQPEQVNRVVRDFLGNLQD